ncbi:MAG: photosynthetic complex assembly protein PuhC [Pseudomonadota bacterium]
MSDPFRNRPFPKPVLYGAAGLVLMSLVLVTIARLSGYPLKDVPDGPVQSARELLFEDRADGAVVIIDAETMDQIAVLAGGTNGFTRSLMRGFAHDRRRVGVSSEMPFSLKLMESGRLILMDRMTGRVTDLTAFGKDNAQAFARFLPAVNENRVAAAGGDVRNQDQVRDEEQ